MFGDIGFAELLLIGIIALIVVGPEDLPQMFRQIGRFTAKIKAMGREFSRAMEQAAADTGINDVAKDLKSATSAKAMGLDKVKEAADRFEKWDPIKNAAKPTSTPARVAEPAAAVAEAVAEPRLVGPETQALMDKQVAKQAILKDTAQKLKEVSSATDAKPKAATTPKPRAKKAVTPAVAPKPRAPRKTKKADEA